LLLAPLLRLLGGLMGRRLPLVILHLRFPIAEEDTLPLVHGGRDQIERGAFGGAGTPDDAGENPPGLQVRFCHAQRPAGGQRRAADGQQGYADEVGRAVQSITALLDEEPEGRRVALRGEGRDSIIRGQRDGLLPGERGPTAALDGRAEAATLVTGADVSGLMA